MNPFKGMAPQKRPDNGIVRPKATICRKFKGFGSAMMSFRPTRKISRFALAATLGAVLMVGFAGTFAQAADDDDDDVLLDTKIFRGIMKGLGWRKDGASIDYRERSPLVLPPSKDFTQLPSPQDASARKQPDWPDDPDVKRVRLHKEAEKKRKPSVTGGIDDRPLLPNQLSNGTAAPVGNKAGEAPGQGAEASMKQSSPAELGTKGISSAFGSLWAPKEEYAPFTGEPPRTALTEPPRGYRTPSPTQPYGVGKDRWVAPVIDKNEPVH
jgi:hypothetical protein